MSKAWFLASNRWGNANTLSKIGSPDSDKVEPSKEAETLRRD